MGPARHGMGSTAHMQQQRRSAKAPADKAQWRSRVRAECLQRVKDQRAALLWRLRQGAEADVKLMLADIISDVSSADVSRADVSSADVSSSGASPATVGSGGGAAAAAAAGGAAPMDEDAAPRAPAGGGGGGGGAAAARPAAAASNILESALELGHGEYEELMRSMEASLFKDLRRDEAAFLAEQAAAADAEVSMLVDLHAGEAGTSGRIRCPVCRNGCLADRNGVLLCSSCALRMDLRSEGLSLEDVRQRLAAVLEEHGAHGCPAQPTFEVDTTFTGVFPSLVMKCVACQSLQVVV